MGIITSFQSNPAMLAVALSIGAITLLLSEKGNRIIEFGAITSFVLASGQTGLYSTIMTGDIESILYVFSYMAIRPFEVVNVLPGFQFPMPTGISKIDLLLGIPIVVGIFVFRQPIKNKYKKILGWERVRDEEDDLPDIGIKERGRKSGSLNFLLLLTIPVSLAFYKLFFYILMIYLESHVPTTVTATLSMGGGSEPLFLASGSLTGLKLAHMVKS